MVQFTTSGRRGWPRRIAPVSLPIPSARTDFGGETFGARCIGVLPKAFLLNKSRPLRRCRSDSENPHLSPRGGR